MKQVVMMAYILDLTYLFPLYASNVWTCRRCITCWYLWWWWWSFSSLPKVTGHGWRRYNSPRHCVFRSPYTFHQRHTSPLPDVVCPASSTVYWVFLWVLCRRCDHVGLRCIDSVLSQGVQNSGASCTWLFEVANCSSTSSKIEELVLCCLC